MSTSQTATIWDRLSPSCLSALGWALAFDSDVRSPTVYTENLLLGLVRVHEPTSEPEVLLKHFGHSAPDLEIAVQRVSRHHLPGAQTPRVFADVPAMSRNTRRALDEAARLTDLAGWPGDTIHAPHLFGGLLSQNECFAYRALEAVLAPGVDVDWIARRYIEDFLPQGTNVRYESFLAVEESPPPAPTDEISQPLRDPVRWLDDARASKDLLRRHSLADAIADRLKSLDSEKSSGRKSFLVHIDGPWGSGKSTLLEFLHEDLAEDWLIVQFDAWRQSRVGP